MYLAIIIGLFLLALRGLYKEGVIEKDHIPLVIVLGGFALAGYLGVSQY